MAPKSNKSESQSPYHGLEWSPQGTSLPYFSHLIHCLPTLVHLTSDTSVPSLSLTHSAHSQFGTLAKTSPSTWNDFLLTVLMAESISLLHFFPQKLTFSMSIIPSYLKLYLLTYTKVFLLYYFIIVYLPQEFKYSGCTYSLLFCSLLYFRQI